MTETSSHVPAELTDTRRSRPISTPILPSGPTASASFENSHHLTAPAVHPYHPTNLNDVYLLEPRYDADALPGLADVDRDDLNL